MDKYLSIRELANKQLQSLEELKNILKLVDDDWVIFDLNENIEQLKNALNHSVTFDSEDLNYIYKEAQKLEKELVPLKLCELKLQNKENKEWNDPCLYEKQIRNRIKCNKIRPNEYYEMREQIKKYYAHFCRLSNLLQHEQAYQMEDIFRDLTKEKKLCPDLVLHMLLKAHKLKQQYEAQYLQQQLLLQQENYLRQLREQVIQYSCNSCTV